MKPRIRYLALIALLSSSLAHGMAAIEYLKLQDAHEQATILKPIVVSFVSSGYRKVPDWPALASETRRVILDKGYTYQNIEDVAKEAAVRLGMTR